MLDEMAEVDLLIKDERWEEVPFDLEALTERALEEISTQLDLPDPTIVSVVLADDALLQLLNRTYRHQDKPTNVLSFPNDPQAQDLSGELGELFLSLDTLKRESMKEGKSLEHHFSHLFVHGVLHLLGYDHEEDEEAIEMESMEICILENLDIPNPYDDE